MSNNFVDGARGSFCPWPAASALLEHIEYDSLRAFGQVQAFLCRLRLFPIIQCITRCQGFAAPQAPLTVPTLKATGTPTDVGVREKNRKELDKRWGHRRLLYLIGGIPLQS